LILPKVWLRTQTFWVNNTVLRRELIPFKANIVYENLIAVWNQGHDNDSLVMNYPKGIYKADIETHYLELTYDGKNKTVSLKNTKTGQK
jgi:hypothetical protein